MTPEKPISHNTVPEKTSKRHRKNKGSTNVSVSESSTKGDSISEVPLPHNDENHVVPSTENQSKKSKKSKNNKKDKNQNEKIQNEKEKEKDIKPEEKTIEICNAQPNLDKVYKNVVSFAHVIAFYFQRFIYFIFNHHK